MGFIKGGMIMSLIHWFGVGYVVVMVILILAYIGVYFGWF